MPSKSNIHITDTQGHVYNVVSKKWVRIVTLLIAAMMISVIVLIVLLTKQIKLSNDSLQFRTSERRRNLVFNELTQKRTQAIEQLHVQLCEARSKLGLYCPPLFDITIDPNKYPDVLMPDGRTFREDTPSTVNP